MAKATYQRPRADPPVVLGGVRQSCPTSQRTLPFHTNLRVESNAKRFEGVFFQIDQLAGKGEPDRRWVQPPLAAVSIPKISQARTFLHFKPYGNRLKEEAGAIKGQVNTHPTHPTHRRTDALAARTYRLHRSTDVPAARMHGCADAQTHRLTRSGAMMVNLTTLLST